MRRRKRHRLGQAEGLDETDDASLERRRRSRTRLYATAIFLVLLGAYLANGDILPGADAVGNVRLAGKLVAKRKLVFTPEEEPFMFTWRLKTSKGEFAGSLRSWHSTINGELARDAYKRGELTVREPGYFLMETPRPGVYASRYGIGAGLFAAPFVAAVYPFASDLYDRSSADVLWFATKVAAASAVAATAVLLFLAGVAFLRPFTSAGLALTYGLATCAWSTDSQALWQHGPTAFFLALGTTFLLQRERPRSACWVGLSYAAAFTCRPTAALVLLSVGIYYLVRDRRALLRFSMGALPVLLLLAVYNLHVFGRVLVFGQMNIGAHVGAGAKASLFNIVPMANAATGSTLALDHRYFGSSVLEGLAGIFVSPSRGLLVFSPVIVLAFWGMVRAFKDPRYVALRPVSIAAALSCLIVAGWFSWWGGWSYGPRLLSDVVILLAFLGIPIAEQIRKQRSTRLVFIACLVWSVAVQFVGAFAYDVVGWNQRSFYAVEAAAPTKQRMFVDPEEANRAAVALHGSVRKRTIDVNTIEGHPRLWSIRDNPILYYLTHFSESRALKKRAIEQFLRDKG